MTDGPQSPKLKADQVPASDDGYAAASGADVAVSMDSGDEGDGEGGVDYSAPLNVSVGE
jgi:hypothetical protein